jgi:hypothetical protein
MFLNDIDSLRGIVTCVQEKKKEACWQAKELFAETNILYTWKYQIERVNFNKEI